MIALLVTLVVIGVITYLVTAFIPMDAKIAQLIRIVALIIAVLVVLQAFGVIGGPSFMVPSGHVRVP